MPRKTARRKRTQPPETQIRLGVRMLVDMGHVENLQLLERPQKCIRALAPVLKQCGIRIRKRLIDVYGPGFSLIATLSISDLRLHTWPEWHAASLDLFSCGPHPRRLLPSLIEIFEPGEFTVRFIQSHVPTNATKD